MASTLPDPHVHGTSPPVEFENRSGDASPSVRVEAAVEDDQATPESVRQNQYKKPRDNLVHTPAVTRDAPGMRITDSIEIEEPEGASSPSLFDKFKGKVFRRGGSNEREGQDPELSYELAAASRPSSGMIPRVRNGRDDVGIGLGTGELGTGYEEDSEASGADESACVKNGGSGKERDIEAEKVKAPAMAERVKEEAQAVSETILKKIGLKHE